MRHASLSAERFPVSFTGSFVFHWGSRDNQHLPCGAFCTPFPTPYPPSTAPARVRIYIYLPRAFYFHPVHARFSVLRGSIRVLFRFFFFFLFSFFSLLPISFILMVKGFLGILSFGKKVSGWRKKGDGDGDGIGYRGCMFLINSCECDSFLSLSFFGFFRSGLVFFMQFFFRSVTILDRNNFFFFF